MKALLPLCILIPLLYGCGTVDHDENVPPTLAEAHALWEARGPDDYTVTLTRSCECMGPPRVILTVRDENLVAVQDARTGKPVDTMNPQVYTTIDGQFDMLAQAIRDDVLRLEMSFDPHYGYPVSIYLDQSDFIDDEITITMSDLRPL